MALQGVKATAKGRGLRETNAQQSAREGELEGVELPRTTGTEPAEEEVEGRRRGRRAREKRPDNEGVRVEIEMRWPHSD